MSPSKTNPYESSATSHPVSDQEERSRISRSVVVNGALAVAVISIIGVFFIIQSLLSVGLWNQHDPVSYGLYKALHVVAFGVFFLGLLACGICAVKGTWIHRIAIAIVAIPYVPIVLRLGSWLTSRIAG